MINDVIPAPGPISSDAAMRTYMADKPGPCDISYRRSRRAKYVRISISPAQQVTVTVPHKMPMGQAETFVRAKHAWIQKHLEKMRRRETARAAVPQLSEQALITAQRQLFARLEHFAAEHNLPYKKAAFRCQKTRWGSCSSRNNISLNINLAFLPAHLQDYVLLHELTHTRHKNHGSAFWSQLNKYCSGRAKALAKELKHHPMPLRR